MSTLNTIAEPFTASNGHALWTGPGEHRRRPQPRATDTVAILYENLEWMEPLFAAMDRRGVRYEGIDLADSAYLLGEHDDHSLVINRVSPSAHLRGHGSAIGLVRGWLEMLERSGKRVINGATSFRLETSKVAQYQLIRDLGLPLPATAVFNDRTAVRRLLHDFPFPAILKPETGGSGANVRFVSSAKALEHLLDTESELFGPDHVLLLQQFVSSGDGSIVRTEFVDGELLFAMRVRPNDTFNLCPAEGCERPSAGLDTEGGPDVIFEYEPDIPQEAVAQAREIVRAARIDVGGVEYIETPAGDRYFYDINSTSVYRADIVAASGVDASDKLVRFIERESRKEQRKLW